jgi:two-component system, OmpR family, alkaline phosphatase synthesis response regulator PhoP
MEPSSIKILLVDDEPDILEILSYNLKKEKFQVFTADNGKRGLELAIELKPDLIILDIMMPEMDGVEVCRRLRANHDFDHTIITFLTARSEDFTQIAAFDYGGDDFINKPIRPSVFISRIKALLRRSDRKEVAGLFSGQLMEGDLTIIPEKFEVIKDGQFVELAKKEFQLLYLLVGKPGKVFTREEIFNKIWGTDVIVGNRTIDVHVRKLREKIGEDYIKTIKGIGYKFESK